MITPPTSSQPFVVKEAHLDDLLNDPLVQQVMHRDGVVSEDLAALVRRTLPLIRISPAQPGVRADLLS